MTNPRLIATAAVSLVVGAAIGYKYAEKKLVSGLMEEFEERLERETNSLRRMHKPDYESPQDMVEKLYGEGIVEVVKEYQGEERKPVAYDKIRVSGVPIGDKAVEEIVERTIFEAADDRGEIHVISAQEHEENKPGYEQVTWSYYAKDGVITDVHEDRIEDYAKYIGNDALLRFGEVSGDENLVHVRNEIIMVDYEIVRSLGSYREEVLGEEMPPERPSQRMNPGG